MSAIQKTVFGFFVAMTLATGVVIVGCTSEHETGSEDSHSAPGTVDKAHTESEKAAAEAEAAEEEFAKAKQSSQKHETKKSKPAKADKPVAAHTATRKTASVKSPAKMVAPSESIFMVQVGTFKIEENANLIAEKLKSAGLPVFKKKIQREGGVVLHAVRIEPTPNHVEAEKFVEQIKTATGETALILSIGK